MGVPALFRWLSKKYPKIVSDVKEEQPKFAPGADGSEGSVPVPVDMSGPNPNGEEFDALYLDMNGIVHPCTHPEGKPAPETEEDMMLEVFIYTERVVNMVRPRKLLMMAIDGVAPRAKMNQQRSRRFRAAQEARQKEEEMEKALAEWRGKGLEVREDGGEKKKSWDRNAITPGTPFMDLLASSLRYWVARKMNEDPGWANLQVIISDASVPGEGEHKIMDHIRRQRVNPAHDPNTKHVIYGLDADLIMLSLATHEPYFKVLREDVFAQAPGGRGCHKCGREGHIAANCIGDAAPPPPKDDMIVKKPQQPEVKPFIFLDVCILREYLEVELSLPNLSFPFDLERAIDDWIFLIFFVGNDFLPHLPSLEIREGAIDELLRIWKRELPLLGGYLTSHGKVDLKNIQRVMEGIASLEDDIFRKRRDAEERQDATQKRRRIEDHTRQRAQHASERRARGEPEPDSETMSHGGTDYVAVSVDVKAQDEARKRALAALESGDKGQVIDNQRAIRMANLSAAERLKAEMAGAKALALRTSGTVKQEAGGASDGHAAAGAPAEDAAKAEPDAADTEADAAETSATAATDDAAIFKMDEEAADATADGEAAPVRSRKRAHDAVAGAVTEDGDEKSTDEDDDAGDAKDDTEAVDPVVATNFERKVNADGTVEYEDTVKLWEPGYRERYYRQKFGVGLDDTDFRRAVVKSYVEGLAWVLAYYYQGCPSWTWYYPYHFSPFAADFVDLETLDITFDVGQPFRPYDQLMGVLPADSRASIPPVFHPLMLEEDSEIIDFYPSEFAIDMNGKKMEWQGVALLPFIDEKRLLTAINRLYPELSDEELRRNAFGDHTLFVSEQHPLYDYICVLYGKRKSVEPVPLDTKLSGGISGTVRPDPACLPGTTFSSPLSKVGEPDITSDRSISSLYEFPEQTAPHRSVLLKGLRPPPKVLTNEDREWTRAGAPDRGRGRGRGRGGRGGSGGPGSMPSHSSMRFGNGPVAAAQNQHTRWGSNTSSPYGTPTGYDSPYGSYGSAYGGSSYGGTGSGYNSPARAGPPHQQPGMHQGGYGGAGYGGGAPYGGAPYGGPPPPAQQYGGWGGYGAANGGQGGQPAAHSHYGNYAAPPPPQQQQQHQPAYGGYGGYGAPQPAYGGYGSYGQPAAQPYAGQPYAPPPSARGGAPVPLGMRGPPPGRGGGPPGRGGGAPGGRGRGSSGWGQY